MSTPTRHSKTQLFVKRNFNELVLVGIILILIVGMSIASPIFFSVNTLFSVLRSMIVPTVFALGVLMVIVSGGIDVSFYAIGIFAAYSVVALSSSAGLDLGLIVVVILAGVIGAFWGSINGFVIARFRLPTLIVTLGTAGIIKGVLLAYIGSRYIADIPTSLASLSTMNLVVVDVGGRPAALHMLVIPVIIIAAIVAWILTRTMFGRGLYAIGGDEEAARRAGFPVVRYQVLLYILVGVLAAIGGLLHVILNRNANPQDLAGAELDIIAAVVLGGASIFGGKGSVPGAVLGVLLVQLINNSLLMVGVPTAWQRTVVGILLIVGVGVQALSTTRAKRRAPSTDLIEEVS